MTLGGWAIGDVHVLRFVTFPQTTMTVDELKL